MTSPSPRMIRVGLLLGVVAVVAAGCSSGKTSSANSGGKTKKSGTKVVVVLDILGTEAMVVDSDYQVGQLIWSRLEIENSFMRVYYQKGGSKTTSTVYTSDKTGDISTSGWYFKFGNYLQSNPSKGSSPTESTDEYAEVILRSVTVTHG